MYCYKCGCELNRTDHCPNCGADVATYKKIIYTSNYLYNDGLQKAQVRDLTGAILALKNSLWFNKDNLDARNLLGLIYYEIGETVAALSEWVISKNINDERLHRKNNPGADYLAQVQASRQTMENLDASIERYNHALECCYSGNLDVAVLQLKKVLTVNPHYLRARQLLVLLYIESKQYKRAAKEIQKCLALDVNNTDTLRYRKEVETQLAAEDGTTGRPGRAHTANVRTVKTAGLDGSGGSGSTARGKTRRNRKPKVGSVIKYTADNETIIQPVNARNPGVDGFGLPSWIYGGVIGLLVGAVAVGFVVMPARVQSIRSETQQQIRDISAESDTKDSRITDLQSQVDTLTSELTTYQEQEALSETGNDPASKRNSLMLSAAYYIEDSVQVQNAADALGKIDPDTSADDMSEEYVKLYNDLYPLLRAQILQDYATAGIEAYEKATPDYETAMTNLEMANKFEDTANYGQTWPQRQYYLADSYYQLYQASEDKTQTEDYISKAREVIRGLAQAFPDSEYTAKANALLEQLPEVTAGTTSDAAGASTADDTGETAGTDNAARTTDGAGDGTGGTADSTAAGTAGSTTESVTAAAQN